MRNEGYKRATEDARKFLERIKKLDVVIQNKITEKAQWEALALATTSRLSEDKVQTTPNPQRKSEALEKVIDIELEIERLIDRLIYEKREVLQMIEQLPAIEYDTLHRMYLQYFELSDIAKKHKKSYGWAKNMHYRSLVHLQELLNKEKRKSL